MFTKKDRDAKWWVDINKVRTDYVRIENLAQFTIGLPPLVHPDHPDYIMYWARATKKCIEGMWGKEFGKYRFMSGKLFFVKNYTVIKHTLKGQSTKSVKPTIFDYYWDFAYTAMISKGFSGFIKDEQYTSCNDVLLLKSGFYTETDLNEYCFKPNGDIKEYVDPWKYLCQLHDKPLGRPLFYNECIDKMTLGSRGGGKATPLYVPVLTPNGWVTMGDIKVGDTVVDSQGDFKKVTHTFPQGSIPVWQVTLQDGRTIKCAEDHLWNVRTGTGKVQTLSTGQMFNRGLKYKAKRGDVCKYQIPNCKAIKFEEKELPLDPYILGCLLGDGAITGHTPKIASSDEFIINYFKDNLDGFEIKYDSSTTNNYTIVDRVKCKLPIKSRSGNMRDVRVGNRLTQIIKSLKLNVPCKEKFIPDIYKFSSIEQRMELLRGLMDTDGCITKNGAAEFTNTCEQLIDDVAELCRGLGIRCMKALDKRAGQEHVIKGHKCLRSKYWRLYINTTKEIVKLPRKLERIKKKHLTRHDFVSIVDIQPLNYLEEQKCITVDSPDHTYITKDYIVTHNTYFPALGEIEHRFLFANAKSYNEYRAGGLQTNSLVGGAEPTKSSGLLQKFRESQDAKADSSNADFVKWFGIWGVEEDDDFTPSPFYKRYKGTLECPNKTTKDIFRDSYKIRASNGVWKEKNGDNLITHLNFNHTKSKAAQSAASGRHEYADFEEVGESPIIIDIRGSTENCFKRGSRIGFFESQGTSGNIEFIHQTKSIFLDPRSHKHQAFKNQNGTDGENGECCYFLPNYIVQFDCKDKNGNTNFQKAIDKVNLERKKASESKSAKVLYDKLLNEPCYTHEMWASSKGYYLPYEEAIDTEMYLMEGNRYRQLMTPVSLSYGINTKYNGVKVKVLHDAEPHTEFPIPKKMADPSGCICIYEYPETGLNVPKDLYCWVGHDPYVEEDIEHGGSLGVAYVLMNPKYISQGYKGNIIVATYIGKPVEGLDHYNSQLLLLMQMYRCPDKSLWYEKNRGDIVRSFFIKKNRFNLLALTPNREQGSSVYEKQSQSTGVFVGAKGSTSKLNLIKNLKDWLLEETTFMEDGELVTKLNIQRIPCLFTIRQIINFNLVDNFDGVSSLLVLILGYREYMNIESATQIIEEEEGNGSIFDLYNSKLFKSHEKRRFNKS